MPGAPPLLSGGSKRASPENREEKKTPMPARDQPLAPKKQTALETRKPKGRKKE
jgi:hypothetical protein